MKRLTALAFVLLASWVLLAQTTNPPDSRTPVTYWTTNAPGTGAAVSAKTVTERVNSYVSTLGIRDASAIDRLRGFAAELDALNLSSAIGDAAFLEPDVNTWPVRSLNLAYGTNNAGTTNALGGLWFYKTNVSEWPAPVMTGWAHTLVVCYNGRTNTIGDTFVPWGVYGRTGVPFSGGHNVGNDIYDGTTYKLSGAPFDPISRQVVWWDNRERVVATTFDNVATNIVWADGFSAITNAAYLASPLILTGAPSRLVFGMKWAGGTTYSYGAQMSVRGWLVAKRVLSRAEIQAVDRAFRRLHRSQVNHIYYGDSQIGPSTNCPGAEFATLLEENYYANRNWWRNMGTPGSTAELLATDDYLTNRIKPYAPTGYVTDAVLHDLSGVNDLGAGKTAAATYAKRKIIWSTARAWGFKVIAYTQQPLYTNAPYQTNWTAAMEAQRVALNNYVLGDRSQYDQVIRRDLLFGPNEVNPTANYLYDGLHSNTNGHALQARQVAGEPLVSDLVTATAGTTVRSNAWLNVPTLNEGDVWLTSSNGVPHVIWKFGGTLTTNRLIP